jgi:predicted polyphosphate/ATP-dependent NAD kinase
MSSVGIIANPSSGKDIRRIVAQGWVVTNQEKVAITRRLLRGLEAAGVEQVFFMPEPRGICQEAYTSLGKTGLTAKTVNIPVTARQEDSTASARAMADAGVSCIVTLGGDGTNRAVFKGSGPEVPLLPVSTGTNNVFPEFQEGTTAGYAAGLLATGQVSREVACWRSKVLLVRREEMVVDLALVDLAVSTDSMIGARAIWEVSHLKELFLTRAQPWSIGLSAIGGVIDPVAADGPQGLHLVLGSAGEGRKVRAPIGPGLFSDVTIARHTRLNLGDQLNLKFDHPVALALDGERDLIARPGEQFIIELSSDGPLVIETNRAVTAAVTRPLASADYSD